MMSSLNLPVARFLQTLKIVAKEGRHLTYSWNRLFNQNIDVNWVEDLEQNADCAEQMEAFLSRFGRLQDTIADKFFHAGYSRLRKHRAAKLKYLIVLNDLGC